MYLKNLSKIELSMGNRQIFSGFDMDLFLLQSGAVFDPNKDHCSFIQLESSSDIRMRFISDHHKILIHHNPCDRMYFVKLRRNSSTINNSLYIKNIFPLSIIMTGYIGATGWTLPF